MRRVARRCRVSEGVSPVRECHQQVGRRAVMPRAARLFKVGEVELLLCSVWPASPGQMQCFVFVAFAFGGPFDLSHLQAELSAVMISNVQYSPKPDVFSHVSPPSQLCPLRTMTCRSSPAVARLLSTIRPPTADTVLVAHPISAAIAPSLRSAAPASQIEL